MIFVTTTSAIEGYHVVGHKGAVQGETFDGLQKNAEALGANAILNTCYGNAFDVDTLFHGAALVLEPIGPLTSRFSQLTLGEGKHERN